MSLSKILEKMNNNVKIQFIHDSIVASKDKKRTGDTEITFATQETDTTQIHSGTGKIGMVIWFDKDEYNAAVDGQ
jgi:chorismate synthase